MELDQIIQGDALEELTKLPEGAADCCVTSPPYLWLRDYKVLMNIWPEVAYSPMPGLPEITVLAETSCLGLEDTVEAYVGHLVLIFRKVRRVLKPDGTLWLNLGDTMAGSGKGGHKRGITHRVAAVGYPKPHKAPEYLDDKNVIGAPWRVAFALQADGWYLRSDIILSKANPLPEYVRDRPAKAHEYMFLLSKQARYYYDHAAVKVPCSPNTHSRGKYHEIQKISEPGHRVRNNKSFMKAIWGSKSGNKKRKYGDDRDRPGSHCGASVPWEGDTRNLRDVWTIVSEHYGGPHYATFGRELIRPCIRAGCPPDGIVLDPFAGTGTVGQVALEEKRNFILIELSPSSVRQAKLRIYRGHEKLEKYAEAEA